MPDRHGLTQAVSSYVPSLTINFHPSRPVYTKQKLNKKKLALLIETEPKPWLPALLAHNIQMAPSDWRFLFVGSNQSIVQISQSQVVRRFADNGKLQIKQTPINILRDEQVDQHASKLLSNMTFYNKFLKPAEHLFVFNSNSVLCSGGGSATLDDWLQYDWITSPAVLNTRLRGNGGISLRRISQTRRVLKKSQRPEDMPEATFFANEFQQLTQNMNIAPPDEGRKFVMEDEFIENPFAIHIPVVGTDLIPAIWDEGKNREKIFEACTEIRLIIPMKLGRERCTKEE